MHPSRDTEASDKLKIEVGGWMSNQATVSDMQGKTPVKQQRDWQKPVLDILELQSAAHLHGAGGDTGVHTVGSHGS